MPPSTDGAGNVEVLKRKYRDTLEEHAMQLETLHEEQAHIVSELTSLFELAKQRKAVGRRLCLALAVESPMLSVGRERLGRVL